ncbi:Cas10/Cmr2 second palm domain-containing protein [Endothiovibrio diazotrophicus]
MNDGNGTAMLRIEGVNLAAVLDDTDDISVRRGAGLLLRQAILQIEERWQNELTAVSTGASVGLFRLNGDTKAEDIREEVAHYLNHDENYRHLTFVVDIDRSGSFAERREALIAKNRFRQLSQPSLALPAPGLSDKVCDYDRLRPADGGAKLKKREHASGSVRARFEFGRKQRQRFYADELGMEESELPAFTDDLHELTDSNEYGNLNEKMAVIYFDGNKFGEIQRDFCKDEKGQAEWDSALGNYRRGYLQDLILLAREDEAFLSPNGERLRLELLLWGGDEIMLVVPAWRGFEVLHHFYSRSEKWTFKGRALRHAGGLVFCHRKTPIPRVTTLAKQLAERAKGEKGKFSKENRYDYLVLESIDFPAEPLEQFLEKRYGSMAYDQQPLLVQSPPPYEFLPSVRPILDPLPFRPFRALAESLIQGVDCEKRVARLNELIGDGTHEEALTKLEKKVARRLFPGIADEHWGWRWLHLVELWDYIAPQPTRSPR